MASGYYTIRLKKRNAPKRLKRQRPRSFNTTEAADAWAKEHKIKKYHLRNLRITVERTPKIIIVEE